VGATCAGNPRPNISVATSELEVLAGQHSIAKHVSRAGPQQMFGKHLLGKGSRVLRRSRPSPGYNVANSGRSRASRTTRCWPTGLQYAIGLPPALHRGT
jgi:hypothetical protein